MERPEDSETAHGQRRIMDHTSATKVKRHSTNKGIRGYQGITARFTG